jgi:hypothetical protein
MKAKTQRIPSYRKFKRLMEEADMLFGKYQREKSRFEGNGIPFNYGEMVRVREKADSLMEEIREYAGRHYNSYVMRYEDGLAKRRTA